MKTGKRKKVLLILKGERSQNALVSLFCKAGIATVVVGSAQCAVWNFREAPPSLVILSLAVGNAGAMFLKCVRKHLPRTPVIVICPSSDGFASRNCNFVSFRLVSFVRLPASPKLVFRISNEYLNNEIDTDETRRTGAIRWKQVLHLHRLKRIIASRMRRFIRTTILQDAS